MELLFCVTGKHRSRTPYSHVIALLGFVPIDIL
jgi:hypothetical protein